MILQVLHCPHCQGTDIVRHGQTRQGKQRYRCREQRCAGRTFLLDYSYPGQSPAVKQQIVEMAMNASGIRDTARVLHISTNTVMTELKKTRVAKLAGVSLLQAARDTMLDRGGSDDAACAADDGSQDAGAAPARSASGREQAPPP
jgi:transposase-like protein